MKSALVVCLVLSLVIGLSVSQEEGLGGAGDSGGADNGGGVGNVGGIGCFIQCISACSQGAKECALCIGKCIITGRLSPMNMNHLDTNRNYFCNLGCSTSLCTKLLTDKHSDVKKVKGCMNSCSQSCSNTMN